MWGMHVPTTFLSVSLSVCLSVSPPPPRGEREGGAHSLTWGWWPPLMPAVETRGACGRAPGSSAGADMDFIMEVCMCHLHGLHLLLQYDVCLTHALAVVGLEGEPHE